MRRLRYFQFAAFALVTALYFAIRFWNLTESCLWFDEIFSVRAAEHTWNSLFSFVALDLIHPPLFYVLIKLWIGVGGESLLWLRSFPVFFSIVAIFPFIALCRELKLSFWTQILALFLFAVNGSLIKYAQEVRMYSLLLCLSLFSMWLFTRYFLRGKSLIPLLIINILLVYTHYFGWFAVVSEVVAILIFQRIKWRRMLTMFAITLVSFTPWAIAVISASRTGSELGQNIGWMSRPGLREVVTIISNLVEPFYYQSSTADPISIFKVSLPILLIAMIAVGLYVANWKKQSEDERETTELLIWFVALPLVSAFVLSWLLPYSIWGTRHLIIVFAPISILIATAITRISIPTLKIAAITLILLFSGYGFALKASSERPQYSWCAWEHLTTEAAAKGGSNIYTFEDLVAYHVWFAGRDQMPNKVFKVNGIDGITEDKAYFLPRGSNDVGTVNFDGITDTILWIAYRSKTVGQDEAPIRSFIVKGYHIIDQQVIEANGESANLVLLENSGNTAPARPESSILESHEIPQEQTSDINEETIEKILKNDSKTFGIENLKQKENSSDFEIRIWSDDVTLLHCLLISNKDGKWKASMLTGDMMLNRRTGSLFLKKTKSLKNLSPKSGWKDVSDDFFSKGIRFPFSYKIDEVNKSPEPDEGLVKLEFRSEKQYGLVFYQKFSDSDDAKKIIQLCRWLQDEFNVDLGC